MQDQDGIRSAWAGRSHQPCHQQHPILLVRNVHESPQFVNVAAADWVWQRGHAACPAKPNRDVRNYTPSIGINLDSFPPIIAEVEIDAAVFLGEAHENRTLRPHKVGFTLKYPDSLLDSLVFGSTFGLIVITPKQPLPEPPALQGPVLEVSVNRDRGVRLAVRCVKKFCFSPQRQQAFYLS